jgi:SAM-dependent methyltransferase
MMVELGGGSNPHPRADIVLDTAHPKPSQRYATDVGSHRWPVDSETADEIYSSHLLEHIPKGGPIINLFNEAARILRPGGRFVAVLPLIGFTDEGVGTMVAGWQPYADPTHVQGWWLPESVMYFTGEIAPGATYGIPLCWQDLGPRITPERATRELNTFASAPTYSQYDTFWAVRDGWEGVFSLVKKS